MSTALVSALRESSGYLSDDGYHQTARLLTSAATEIERLHREIAFLKDVTPVVPTTSGALGGLRRALRAVRVRRPTIRPAHSASRERGT
jgi:hypothetical protein